MSLLPFEPRTLARATDPSTSHDAAKACRDLRAAHHELILWALRQHQPASACAISDVLYAEYEARSLDKVQVGRRLHELLREGRIEVVDRAGVTDTGRAATRYVIVADIAPQANDPPGPEPNEKINGPYDGRSTQDARTTEEDSLRGIDLDLDLVRTPNHPDQSLRRAGAREERL